MRGVWAAIVRIPLRYTVVSLFCLLVVTLLAIGREGLQAIVPAAIVTVVVGSALFVPSRRRRRRRGMAADASAGPAVGAPAARVTMPPARAEARVRSAVVTGVIQHAFAAEPGWRALFGDGAERTMSRLVGWAVTTSDDGATEVVGLIVDPGDPSRIVPAPGVVTPEGQSLARYGFKEA